VRAEAAKRTIIFSDVHLDPAVPETQRALVVFLEDVRAAAPDALVCLGDLFHYWVGRGHEGLSDFEPALDALARVVSDGVRFTLVPGNRDFLAGEGLRARIGGGARIAGDQVWVEAGRRRLLCGHGDLLLARDTRYRAMRRVIRSGLIRRVFGAMPLAWRLRVGTGMRGLSEREVRAKPARAFSISKDATARLCRRGADAAVIGHVHRAARRVLEVDGRPFPLFSLGAWEGGNVSWLEVVGERLRLFDGPSGSLQLTHDLA